VSGLRQYKITKAGGWYLLDLFEDEVKIERLMFNDVEKCELAAKSFVSEYDNYSEECEYSEDDYK
jgi:hypothetical protein